MKSSSKRILLLAILAALVGGYFFLGSLLGRAAVAAVNKYGPPLTGTQVTLGSAHVSPFTGGGWLKKLFVGNPTGFKTAKAFSVERVAVKVKPLSLLGEAVDLEEVVIENPEFIYETKLISSNLGTILDNLEKGSGDGQPQPSDTASGTKSKKLIIRHFVLEGAKVTISAGGTSLTVPLARLELTDIGVAKGGVTPAEAATEILPQVLEMVTQTAVSTLGDRAFRDKAVDLGKQLGNAAQELIDQVRGK
jgi:hypothetical protein